MPIKMVRPDGTYYYNPPSYFRGFFRTDQLPKDTAYGSTMKVPADNFTYARVLVFYHVVDNGILLTDEHYHPMARIPFSQFPSGGIDLTINHDWRVTITEA